MSNPLTVDLTDLRPTQTQAQFLRCRSPRAAFFSGYGGGKTRAFAEKALLLALANPGCAGQIVAPTWRMLERVALDAFMQACPRELIARYAKSERRIDLTNGARVLLGSADNPGSLEGTTLAWAGLDEARLMVSEVWRVMVGRMRETRAALRQLFVTTTPAMGWLSEEFGSARPGHETFKCSTEENRCNLPPGFIEDLRHTYSARLAKSLIDGEFSVVAGQVYEEFDETKHAVSWRYRPGLPLWLAWDFGVRAASILLAQWTGDFPVQDDAGRKLPPHSVVVFDELQPEQMPTIHQIPLVKRALAALCPAAPPVPWAIAVDPAGRARDQASGMPSVALLRDAFGPVVRWATEFADRHIPNRIARVQGALAPVEGPPRLYLDRGLLRGHRRGVAAALRGTVYDEKEGRRLSDHPKATDLEHADDTLGYLVVNCALAYGQRMRPPSRLALA